MDRVQPSRRWVFVTAINGDPANRKQLTFKGNRGTVFGVDYRWKNCYAAYESAPFPDAKGLSFVRRTGGQPQHTGIAEIGYAWFDPNGRDMIYSKSALGTGVNAKFHGGGANQVLCFDLANGELEHLYPSRWARHSAVVCHGEVYFIGTEGESSLNLWKANQSGIHNLPSSPAMGREVYRATERNMVLEIREACTGSNLPMACFQEYPSSSRSPLNHSGRRLSILATH